MAYNCYITGLSKANNDMRWLITNMGGLVTVATSGEWWVCLKLLRYTLEVSHVALTEIDFN